MKKNDNEKNKPLKAKSFAELEKALQKEKEESNSIRAMNRRLDANIQQLMVANEQIRASKHQLYIEVIERQQTERKLRYSEAMLREAQHLAQTGSWELDLLTNRLYWSDEIYKIFNLNPRQFKASYQTFLSNIHPEDKDSVDKAYTDSVKNRTSYKITHRLLLKDGTVKFVTEQCETFYSKAGKPIRSIGTIQDITERKREMEEKGLVNHHLKLSKKQLQIETLERKKVEKALKESEVRYRTLFETAVEGILIADVKTKKFNYANPAICKMLGYSEKEIIGMSVLNIHPKKDLKNVLATFEKQAREEKPIADNLSCQRKDGTIFYVDITVSVEIIDGKKCNIGFFTDITERKLVEKELSEAYNIINHSPAVTFLWKNERGWPVEFVSENVQKLTGYSRKEFIEGKISYADIIHGDDIERVVKEVAAYSKKIKLQSFNHSRYRIVTKSGDIKWVEDTTYIRRDARNIITHHEGIVYDITERQNAEKVRTTLYSMDDLVFVNDKNGKFTEFYQPSGNTELYVPPEVFLGKTYKEVLPAKVAKVFQKTADYVVSTGRVKEIKYSLTINGAKEWYCSKVSKRKDNTGKFSGVITVARNITKSKLLENKLKESDKKNMALLELTDKGYLILDGEGKVIDANREYINLSGHKTLKEILGRNVNEWVAVAHREKIAKIIKKCLAQRFVENVKVNYTGKKGSIIPVEFSARVVKNDKRVQIITICSVIKANKKQ